MKKTALVLIFILTACCIAAAQQSVTVEVIGESAIINNDLATAKIQAEMRAKWAAMEKATQVKVSVDTVIHNAELLDESVKSVISGSVTKFEIIDEGIDQGTYWVQAKATVEPEKAADILSRSTTIAVCLPMVKTDGSIEESNPFSEEVINQLIEKGFQVVDFSSDPQLAQELVTAVQNNNSAEMRRLVSQYAAGSAIVGRLIVMDKGKNVGYANISFSIVDGSLSYRIISSDSIIKSGTLTARGQGATDETAAYNLSTNMAKRESTVLSNEAAMRIMGANKKSVRIELLGNTDMRKFQEFRDIVKNTSWVLNLKEVGTNAVVVDYPEKTMYLASIISRNGGYKIKSFSENEIIVLPR